MARVVTSEKTLTGWLAKLDREANFLASVWKYELTIGGVFAGVGILLGLAGGGWFMAGLGGFFLFFGVSHALKRGETAKEKGWVKGGARGEEEVTALLSKKLPDSYLILNDLDVAAGTRKAQNDHIVLGPNGIFVIETKAYSGRIVGDAKDDKVDQLSEWKGRKSTKRITNPVSQNERHCSVLAEKMKSVGFATDDIVSIVVFTNKWARIEITGAEIPVVKPPFLIPTIINYKAKYNYDEDYLGKLCALLAPESPVPPAAPLPPVSPRS